MEDELNIICDKCGRETYFVLGKSMLGGDCSFIYSPSENRIGSMWSIVPSYSVTRRVAYLMDHKKGYFNQKEYGFRLYYSYKEEKLYCLFYFSVFYLHNGYRRVYHPEYMDSFNEKMVLFSQISPGKRIVVRCGKCNQVIYDGKKEFFMTSMQVHNKIKIIQSPSFRI